MVYSPQFRSYREAIRQIERRFDVDLAEAERAAERDDWPAMFREIEAAWSEREEGWRRAVEPLAATLGTPPTQESLQKATEKLDNPKARLALRLSGALAGDGQEFADAVDDLGEVLEFLPPENGFDTAVILQEAVSEIKRLRDDLRDAERELAGI